MATNSPDPRFSGKSLPRTVHISVRISLTLAQQDSTYLPNCPKYFVMNDNDDILYVLQDLQ